MPTQSCHLCLLLSLWSHSIPYIHLFTTDLTDTQKVIPQILYNSISAVRHSSTAHQRPDMPPPLCQQASAHPPLYTSAPLYMLITSQSSSTASAISSNVTFSISFPTLTSPLSPIPMISPSLMAFPSIEVSLTEEATCPLLTFLTADFMADRRPHRLYCRMRSWRLCPEEHSRLESQLYSGADEFS